MAKATVVEGPVTLELTTTEAEYLVDILASTTGNDAEDAAFRIYDALTFAGVEQRNRWTYRTAVS